ncbi:MAG: nucleoside triphosphate pyrophosphohydrolase [Bacillota bacterium]|jgi:tetrapyrrole methylase family protein/MazG family protein
MVDAAAWQKLADIMAALRAPNGCPWDQEQDHHSLKRYLVEETYEVLDAIDSGNDENLCDELGDLLLQVVFHAQIASEQGRFTLDDVVNSVSQKMIRRHPHVFADTEAADAQEVLSLWEEIKAQEKDDGVKRGLMHVNHNLPALLLAQKVQDKAARVGFDWQDITGPQQKLKEELQELKEAQTTVQQTEELGDVIFSVVNLARFMQLDAESALRQTIKKFIGRFSYIEKQLTQSDISFTEAEPDQLEMYWQESKKMGL